MRGRDAARPADVESRMSHGRREVGWEADTQQEIAGGGARVGKPVVSLMSLHVGQRRQPFLFLCYVTAEQSGGSRTTLMLTGGKEHSSLPEAGCCISSVEDLLNHLLTSRSSFCFSLTPHCEPAKREELDPRRHKGILLTLKTFWTVPHLLAAVNHSVVTTIFTIIWRIQPCLYTGGHVDFRLDQMDWALDSINAKVHFKDCELHQMDLNSPLSSSFSCVDVKSHLTLT